jgi:hypothetical protein
MSKKCALSQPGSVHAPFSVCRSCEDDDDNGDVGADAGLTSQDEGGGEEDQVGLGNISSRSPLLTGF